MEEMKDTQSASVRIGFDGRVHKTYRGLLARERFENELRVLRYLEEKGCNFVPRVLEAQPDKLYLVTTNCGRKVESLSDAKMNALFDELTSYGVEHDDRAVRNITYSPQAGRFCLIDFEFAKITGTGEGLSLQTVEDAHQAAKEAQRSQMDD